MKNFITKKRIYSISGIIFLIVCWKLVSLYTKSDQLVPPPEQVLYHSILLFKQAGFFSSLGATVARGLAGFILSLVLALIIGFPAGTSRSFSHFINPLLITVRSTPVISLILLAIIWFGNELVPVFIAVLTMFPVICQNIIEGIRNVDPELVEMGKSYRIKRKQLFSGIYLPSILPFLTSGISSALGFGWRSIIIGEVLSQPQFGIGKSMQEARTFLLVSDLIAWTLIAILISYIFEMLIRQIEKAVVRWK